MLDAFIGKEKLKDALSGMLNDVKRKSLSKMQGFCLLKIFLLFVPITKIRISTYHIPFSKEITFVFIVHKFHFVF